MTNKNSKSTHLEKTDLPQKTDLKKLTGLQELKLEHLDAVAGGHIGNTGANNRYADFRTS